LLIENPNHIGEGVQSPLSVERDFLCREKFPKPEIPGKTVQITGATGPSKWVSFWERTGFSGPPFLPYLYLKA
jgi:hypothetical protein